MPYKIGLTAAIIEMLVFSTANEIYAFNALPKRIAHGEIGPLLTRTGSEILLRWSENTAEIEILHKCPDKNIELILQDNMKFDKNNNSSIKVLLMNNQKYKYKITKD